MPSRTHGGRRVVPVAVSGADGLPLLAPLRSALSGDGPVVAPHAADAPPPPWAADPLGAAEDDPDDPTVAVVATTGSTGRARPVLLQASALRASAAATEQRLGGAGTWLLAVPAHTVAGLMVCVRSLAAGTAPVVQDLRDGFRVDGFASAAGATLAGARGTGTRAYTSLVPTQLRRLLDAPGENGERARAALAGLDAVLVGGAALDAATRQRAELAGVRVVETYGMTETCGGCVYDGTALPGVTVALDPLPDAGPGEGRVVLGGPALARGYRSGSVAEGTAGFDTSSGARVFHTTDRGRVDGGRLEVLGRLDDVAVCGGVNVPLAAVSRAARAVPGVDDALAVAVPDRRWGEVVGLVLAVPAGGVPAGDAAEVRDAVVAAVRRHVGRAATPHHVVVVDAVPLAGVGKPDRAAARRMLLQDAGATPGTTRGAGMRDHGGTAGSDPAGAGTEGRQP